eukprot:4490371-Prymnesium_polylepis.1
MKRPQIHQKNVYGHVVQTSTSPDHVAFEERAYATLTGLTVLSVATVALAACLQLRAGKPKKSSTGRGGAPRGAGSGSCAGAMEGEDKEPVAEGRGSFWEAHEAQQLLAQFDGGH